MLPEDIQNRARNYLSPIQILNDNIKALIDENVDYNTITNIINFLKSTNICNKVDESINKLILLAKGADLKINDETFDIEDFINNEKYMKI